MLCPRFLRLGALSAVLAIPSLLGGALLQDDFDGDGSSPLAKLREHPLLEVVDGEGVDGGRALKATYQGYDRGSRRIVERIDLPERSDEITLCYDVRFEHGFQFVRGGKLHGLGPDRPVTGGNPMTAEGWSARVNFSGGGGVRTYLYLQDNPRQFGLGRGNEAFSFEPDRYHAVSLHVKLNDPPEAANGFARVYVDGERIIDHSGARFRDAGGPETLISQFLFSTFHGGSNPDWAPKDPDGEYATHHAFFDNLAIYSGKRIRAEPGACWENN